MKTCKQCKDDACPEMGVDMPGCDDFTSEAVGEEPAVWTPTLEDYNALRALYDDALDSIALKIERIKSFENAVAELVRWAQGDEAL